MAEALVVVPAVKAAIGELLKLVLDVGKKIVNFKSELKHIETTLIYIQPMFDEIAKLNSVLDRPKEETEMFIRQLRDAKELILGCSTIQWINLIDKLKYSNKLIKLNESLLRFFQVEVQGQMACDVKRTLVGVNQLLSSMKNGSVQEDRVLPILVGSCGVPGLPDHVVGLDKPLRELKEKLLKDGVRGVVLSAPGGCGKTTLAQALCHDEEIRGIFGNIFFVTVSKTANLKGVIWKLFEHNGLKPHNEFQNDEDAIRQLEQFMKRLKGSILLVLDDVWWGWEYLIERFRFSIQGYKILVTSRFELKRFDSTYKLNILNDNDAMTLFCHSAFRQDGNSNIPDDLLKKIVKGCKGFPLALIVVGRSLDGQHEVKWRSLLKEWSKGQFNFESNKDEELLLRLKTSLDEMDEMAIMKECFLDLGSFPEDETIRCTTLMDMWAELYNLEDEDMETFENLLQLSFRNLINLVPRRGYEIEVDGYCDKHFVKQHDLLTELANHQSSQEPIEQRERLIMEICRNELPKWWVEQNHHPIKARLLSISTDEMFSSSWYDMQVPEVEVLILNFQTMNYTLPHFLETMDHLKVLIVTNYGSMKPELNIFPQGGYLSSLRRIRLQNVSISSSLSTSFLEMRNLRKMSFICCGIDQAFEIMCTTKIFPNLIEIEIEGVSGLKVFPAGLCNIVNLKKLSITNCDLGRLPEEIRGLTNLEALRLCGCIQLKGLPESIGSLHKLRFLDISLCPRMSEIPKRIGENLPKLEYVICDEEIARQWEFHKTHLPNLTIKAVNREFLLQKILGDLQLDQVFKLFVSTGTSAFVQLF